MHQKEPTRPETPIADFKAAAECLPESLWLRRKPNRLLDPNTQAARLNSGTTGLTVGRQPV
jgi:hypothetical protein